MVLITSFDDISYVRQKLVYDLWAEMADFQDVHRLTPRTFLPSSTSTASTRGSTPGVTASMTSSCDTWGSRTEKEPPRPSATMRTSARAVERQSQVLARCRLREGRGLPRTTSPEALVAAVGGDSNAGIASGVPDPGSTSSWTGSCRELAEDSAGKNSICTPGRIRRTSASSPGISTIHGARRRLREAPDAEQYRWHNRIFIALQDDPTLRAQLDARAAALHQDGPLNATWVSERLDAYYETLGPGPARDWAHRSAHRVSEAGPRSGTCQRLGRARERGRVPAGLGGRA